MASNDQKTVPPEELPKTTMGHQGYTNCAWQGCRGQQKASHGLQTCQTCHRQFLVVTDLSDVS